MSVNAYDELESIFKKVADLRHVYSITMWDEAAMMPVGGGDARADALATLNVVILELVTSAQVGGLLDRCEAANVGVFDSKESWQAANVREIRRQYKEMTCLPPEFVHAQSIASSKCEQAWRIHRANNDWDAMKPLLSEVIKFAREEANIRAGVTGLSPYDAMLDLYEPGMRSVRLDELFEELKEFLPGFTDEVISRQGNETLLPLGNFFPTVKQRELGLEVMAQLGFDFDHGRLDVSHHPFCGGVQQDVRITTRYTTANFVESIMAVIHETGHAMYEQGRPKGWEGQPVGTALSSGTHESQSLLMEMQLGRSDEFMSYLSPVIRRVFEVDDDDAAWSEENLRQLYTRVEKSFIRVDADELTYPLHVILRYEIEKQLIEGDLEVDDIPGVWNEKMTAYLGVDTQDNFKDGCLQDVHWPASLFGYFPTYSLGAMMAAQLFAAARKSLPGLSEQIARGDFSDLVSWQREHVHSKGSFLSVDELMTAATGETLNVSYFLNHLKSRYGRN